MFIIEKAINREGYFIKIKGRGFGSITNYAKNTEEIGEAVKHFFMENKECNSDICPLCRNAK